MSDQSVDVDEQKAIVDEHVALPTAKEEEQQEAVKDFNKEVGPKEESMKVLVYSPYKTYYEGVAFSLSAESATGNFDILPRHHSFISLLVACEVVIRTISGDERKVKISGGIIHVKADEVVIFLDV